MEISPLNVRRACLIKESPDVVWQNFKSIERFGRWFVTGHTLEHYEPHLHGAVELSVEIDGETVAFGGKIIVFDAERELSFEDNWFGPDAWPVPTFITIRLTPLYDETLVELFHHGFERLGSDAGNSHAGYEEGWTNRQLLALKALVES